MGMASACAWSFSIGGARSLATAMKIDGPFAERFRRSETLREENGPNEKRRHRSVAPLEILKSKRRQQPLPRRCGGGRWRGGRGAGGRLRRRSAARGFVPAVQQRDDL